MPESRLASHEIAFTTLALGTAIALLASSASSGVAAPAGRVAAAGVLYAGFVLATRKSAASGVQKARLAAAYFFALWFYSSVAWITPALGEPLRDAQLLAVDRAVLGETPAVTLARHATFAATEVLSACYLFYQLYLHGSLAHALFQPAENARRLFAPLFTTFALGFAGYLLVPATGPAHAFPELFHAPVEGGLATRANAFVCEHGASIYDAFPSLHIAITSALLIHDLRFHRRRALVLALPCLGLFVSTVYLRYHYFVDLVAGLALAVVVALAFVLFERRSEACTA